jgi:tetratricopeptide (TPR) repeat protein
VAGGELPLRTVDMLASFLLALIPLAQVSGTGLSLPDRANAYYHFSLAQQLRMSGDGEAAIAELQKALRLDPASAEIRAHLARQLRDLGRFDQALAEARVAVETDPDNLLAHQLLSELYRMQVGVDGSEAVSRAAAELEEVLRIEPLDPRALQLLAAYYAELRDHERAVSAWDRLLELNPGNFEAWMRRGMHLRAQGRVDEARESFAEALSLDPDSADARASMGDVLAAEAPDEALPYYEQVVQLDPSNIRVQLALAEVYSRLGRHQDALSRANAVLETDPANRFALERRGRALRELRRFDEAIAAADALLELEPGDLQASFLKVTVAEARRDSAEAARLLEQILERPKQDEDPEQSRNNDRVFNVHLGFAYQQLERYGSAAEAFARARELAEEPDAALATYQIDALRLGERFDDALAVAAEARGELPDDPALIGAEANVRREMGQEEAAEALIEALRARAEGDPAVLIEVADYHQRARGYGDAEEALRAARSLEPDDVRVLFQLGAVLERQRRHDEAEAIFRDALGIEPDSAPVLNYLGYMNADRGVRVEEALGLIERALEIDPENGAYLDSLGWALFRLGRLEQAEAKLRLAVERNRDNAVVLDHLGDILGKRGSLSEAVKYWRLALEGEDEEAELDRQRVERKIQEALVILEGAGGSAVPREPR